MHLPFTIHFLFDGYLPHKFSIDKGVTEHGIIRKSGVFKRWFWERNKSEPNSLKFLVEKYLQENKIQVALCEYGPSGVELMAICEKLNLPLIVHFHGYDAYRRDILETYGKQYTELFRMAAKVVVVSEDMQQQIIKLGCPPEKLRLLPYGVDTTFFKPANLHKKYDFVFCGRFVDKKSPLQIISSFKNVVEKNPLLKMVMIGDGELLNESKNLCARLGLSENVIFKGALSQDEVVQVYQQSKIFINHSVKTSMNDSEGTPVSILEAMSSGLFVVASDHAGIKDVIKNEVNGILIAEGDWMGFEKTLIDCILRWDELSDMREQAVLTIKRKYQLFDQIEALANEIRMVLNE